MPDAEISEKLNRLALFLDRHGLDGAWLQHRSNFAWITGGKDNHIVNASPVGVAAVLVTRDGRRVCFTNTIESPRFRDEELRGTGIEVVDYPWYDRAAGQKAARELVAGRRIAADADELGIRLAPLPDDFSELRWELTDAEIARYRDGAKRATAAMEATCRALKPGISEHEIAGQLDDSVHGHRLNPVVTLIASDERIERYRHPIPTGKKVQRYVMLVTCAEFGGLISCLTRFVHFGPMPDELKRKQQAVCNIDAAVNLATQPGRTLGEIFADLQRAYAANGYADQWTFHHQGGSTGYAGREVVATPDSQVRARANQAFAWNPSITGVKSEDTILCTSNGFEVLTQSSEEWPTIEGRDPDGNILTRPDMLVL
jgi:Xaa-Pro aminopeptidase